MMYKDGDVPFWRFLTRSTLTINFSICIGILYYLCIIGQQCEILGELETKRLHKVFR